MTNEQTKPAFWKRKPFKNGLVILAIILIYPYIHSYLVAQAVKGPAPQFEATTLNGETVNLQQYQGKPVLIHFWATWCPICEHERPDIEKLAKNHSVINIAIQSGTDAQVKAFAQQHNMDPSIIVNDKNRYLENLYSAHGVPASFLVDAQGQIQFVRHGYITFNGMNQKLQQLSQ